MGMGMGMEKTEVQNGHEEKVLLSREEFLLLLLRRQQQQRKAVKKVELHRTVTNSRVLLIPLLLQLSVQVSFPIATKLPAQ